MRARIKVMDLTLGQWDHLQDNLPERFDIPEGAVRVYVEFELDPEMSARHVEMPVRAFTALLTRLQEVQARAEAALTPDALLDELVRQREAADPARAETAQRLGECPDGLADCPIKHAQS